MTALREIEQDLDWREAEMAVLRVLLANVVLSDREKFMLFRAGWALLYAHFEGFCKFALTVYYDSIKSLGKLNCDLAPLTQVFALSSPLKIIRSLPPAELLGAIQSFEIDQLQKPAVFPDVNTDSNLWPATLEKLLKDADLTVDALNKHNRKLGTLVSRRNKIAHGERDLITEYDYFISYEEAVKSVMIELAIRIDDKLSSL